MNEKKRITELRRILKNTSNKIQTKINISKYNSFCHKLLSSEIVTRTIRMNNGLNIMIATSFSLLITFTFYSVLNDKQANMSLFQHIIADTFHYNQLAMACLINQQSM